MIRFLADMGVSLTTVGFLKDLGYDTVHVRNEGLQKASDKLIVEKAQNDSRVILTFDLDFGSILATSSDYTPSVIIFRLDNCTPANVNYLLSTILPLVQDHIIKGAIILIEQDRYRIRNLPIS